MPYHKPLFILSSILFAISITLSPPNQQTPVDVLIIAPHPDDAVLCCAGLIQQSVKQGKTVHVADITDGDGYREAAAVLFKKPVIALTPKDMLRLGKVRRKEEIHALRELGVPTKNISFLGYPDGWLDEVYKSEESLPFTNPDTQRTQTPAGRPFIKTAMVSEVAMLLNGLKPQEIYVTGMTDTALDHQVAYRVVMDAVNNATYAGKLFTYVIHTDNALTTTDNAVRIFLTDKEKQNKQRAINVYRSQLSVDNGYLRSFVDDAETFLPL